MFVCSILETIYICCWLASPIITEIFTCTSTDVPSIVSSDKLAYLDPQEKLWPGQSGRLFMLSEVLCTDNVSPFHGIADFNSGDSSYYPKTLFRFPLRTAASNLSENVYTLEKVLELTNALKAEAKLLLIFLRSVTSIEVYEIKGNGVQTLLFQTKVTDNYLPDLTQKRSSLMQKVRASHKQHKFNDSAVHTFNARFDVSTYECSTTGITTHWLVANQVGSAIPKVLEASVKQKVFPWVGTALELESPGDGRIFCFLPMPIEASSNFPIHINGTFSLNDDRRSLKWPGVERRNDPMANWNHLLVNEVVPSCYVSLLLDAKKVMDAEIFYKAWPIVRDLRSTHWEGLLQPLFSKLLKSDVVWSEAIMQPGEWVIPTVAVYIPQSINRLEAVVEKTLTHCGVKLAKVPHCIRNTFSFAKIEVNEVSPKFVRDSMRANVSSYRSVDSIGKHELLRYCLSDANYADLDQLELLPLANGSFQMLQVFHSGTNLVYLCTSDCPRSLLPNLDHKLVDLSSDADLYKSLTNVANSSHSQLRVLGSSHIASLIDEAMPVQWRNLNIVDFPCNEQFPTEWFKIFWEWVSNKNLGLFSSKLIVPVQKTGLSAANQFSVIRLASSQAVLYIPHHLTIVPEMTSLLTKYGVMCCSQSLFPYLSHPGLASYIVNYSADNILGVICKNLQYGTVELTPREAGYLRGVLVKARNPDLTALRNIKVFMTSENVQSNCISVADVCRQSILKQGMVEPPNLKQLISVLPSSIVVFANSNSMQLKLLGKLGLRAQTPTNFVKDFIFPHIQNRTISDSYVDSIMCCVLDAYHVLCYSNSSITESIKTLRFVKDGLGQRKCPRELFNPSNQAMSLIFNGENMFPEAPYNNSSYIQVLQSCGLRDSVSAQEILDLIYSISVNTSPSPQLVSEGKITRAKAIIEYIQTDNFKCKVAGSYLINRSIYRSYLPFDTALLLLSQNRSWLPVQALAPSFYPSCLPWKGSKWASHVVSLNGTIGLSCSSYETFPLLYGSQAYFTEPVIDDVVFKWLGSHEPTGCLLPHFHEIISHKSDIHADALLNLVSHVYSTMQQLLGKNETSDINALRNMKEWIYIRKLNIFVDVEVVAAQENSTFHHSLEPYLHILPDTLSKYSTLFTYFGMSESISPDQIVSVLQTMKIQISHQYHPLSCALVWEALLAILNWLTDSGTQYVSLDSVLVPSESVSEWPDMKDSKELVYTDNDFLKEFTMSSSSLDEPTLTFVHSRISPSLAKYLKVTPLSEELDVSEDTFTDAGQYEPLTVRLKNILKDYKDGATIVKELIQNADDAEATEINICFDARSQKIEKRSLFFPGMHESHGPALVVHNNSIFSNEDFDNIQKLAAATKLEKQLKIGKFGIGFCSVYHITDVPSFISRNRMYIFDPTLKHLGKEVKNLSQPGKMVKYLSKVIQGSCQLSPYEGLFDFSSSTEFQGTIFRLPFRSAPSELSSTCYTRAHVKELWDGIMHCGDKLLLFLQHVKKITIQQIEDGQRNPTILYELSKCTSTALLHADQKYLTSNFSVQTKDSMGTTCTEWLVANASVSSRCTTIGHGTILSQRKKSKKKAVASVACLLTSSNEQSDKFTLACDLNGEVFCYLPLSQTTGLPVHVSCNFAVISSRRGIWTSADVSSNSDSEAKWNMLIMTNVIPAAYIRLLGSLKGMQMSGFLQNYQFHSLWPLDSKLQMKNPWQEFVTEFYNNLICKELLYSESTANWLKMESSKFLEDDILCNSGVLPCVLDIVNHLKFPLVQLPSPHKHQLSLKNVTLSEGDFVNLFFSNLSSLSDQDVTCSRDEVILCMLEVYALQKRTSSPLFHQLKHCFETYAVIPCRPNGSVLNKCSDLIHPEAAFSVLFDETESRFPIQLFVVNTIAAEAMKEAGMMHDLLPWNLVLEKAQTISNLFQTNTLKALERVKLILKTLTSHVSGEPPATGITIDLVPFLPVLRKPESYPLDWHGEGHHLLCGRELMLSGIRAYPPIRNTQIAGSQVSFICESMPDKGGCGIISKNVRGLLHLRSFPTCSEVIAHLKVMVDQKSDSFDRQWVTTSFRKIYDFLNSTLESSDTDIDLNEMKVTPCIWNAQKFLSIDLVATHWRLKNGPYLYSVPDILVDKKELIEALHIKSHFSSSDAQRALQKMKNDFCDEPVSSVCVELMKDLISIFLTALNSRDEQKLQLGQTALYLPDEHLVLRKSSDLFYNDASWAPKDKAYNYVYRDIPRDLAEALGVRLLRSKMLDQYISDRAHFGGSEFGQHEDLTRRIQNILRDYPFDITVLKELLQNSDDARAKKMYFILDMRTHGKESLISENWQKLQGPALLVWNDSTFSEADLKGIQELGFGNKRSDAETIGQYGIGFNAVYHLTDCPSFITGGETLCILDPHCMYADGATNLSPGRRYDKLNEEFWEKFSDMSSSFLIEGLDTIPRELRGGSLFRFPIRHSQELVKSSKILDPDDNTSSQPLTAVALSENLKEWMPKMKSAMFFLNNVTEIKYMVIEPNSSTLKTVYHFQSRIPDQSKFDQQLDTLKSTISNFRKVANCQTSLVLYPLIITEFKSDHPKESQEKWLVQLGIGDVKNGKQVWQYVRIVKPRHGIAAPLKVSQLSDGQERQLFCFLPLPVKSQVPVHVNGNFILNSTRRNLWATTNPGKMDDKTRWNVNLFQAIASSYADFLVKGKEYYLDSSYRTWKTALNDLMYYCQQFPTALTRIEHEHQLILDVFDTLVQDNSAVLCVFESMKKTGSSTITVKWHPLISEHRADQVYFWDKTKDHSIICPILESLGMNITSTSNKLKEYFNASITKDCPKKDKLKGYFNASITNQGPQIPAISCDSVFEYYNKHSCFSSVHGMKSCLLSKTVFCDVKTFTLLLRYLLKMPLEALKEKNADSNVRSAIQYYKCFSNTTFSSSSLSNITDSVSTGKFPKSPFSHFLLLSADGKLKEFKQDLKCFSSDFSSLFPDSQDKFLHPDLRDLNLHSSYFINTSDSKQIIIKHFLEIFRSTFPPEMLSHCVIEKASSLISKQRMVEYWKCFFKDEVFRKFLPCYLRHVALLQTSDNRLFSTRSEMLPVYFPSRIVNKSDLSVLTVMTKLKMPYLDNSVVTISVDCPTLSDHSRILTNVVCINKAKSLTATLTNCEIDTLIHYFSSNLTLGNSLNSLQSLPFFEDVNGTYQTVNGKAAYVWPMSCPAAGYQSWSSEKTFVFIKSNASWTDLGSAEQLYVQKISAVELYNKFIFPYFQKLSETERYTHLNYIRNALFSSINFTKKQHLRECGLLELEKKEKSAAEIFYNSLLTLKCIGSDNLILLPISSFCDHTQKIFHVFSKYFQILPEILQSPDWLSFFKELNLKQNLTEAEYLQFCQETADRDVNSIRKCSMVLLEYLFSWEVKKMWCSKTAFLSQVSSIPFVFTEKAAAVDWVLPGVSQANQLVKLNGSASMHLQHLVWTVRPIIKLPGGAEVNSELQKKLGVVVQASVSDVALNIRNISKSSFAEHQLFINFPKNLFPPSGVSNLVVILEKNFKFLSEYSDSTFFQELSLLPCIPVYVDLCKNDEKKVALVQPNCVLTSTEEYYKFHPFLYGLPTELSPLSWALKEIGVQFNINLHHMQIVLEKAFKQSDGCALDPNTKESVKSAFLKLRVLLTTQGEPDDANCLAPLYLPDTNNQLKLSTSLLYRDTSSYFRHLVMDFTGTPYSFFNITEKVYGFSANSFCRFLPPKVRPIGMSQRCKHLPDDECQSVKKSEMALRLENSFQDQNNPENVVKIIHVFEANLNQDDLLLHIEKLLSSIHVVTICNLKAKILLAENNMVVGHVKSEYFFHCDESESCLYLDSEVVRDNNIGYELAEVILTTVSQYMDVNLSPDSQTRLPNIIGEYLTSTASKRMELLEKFDIVGTMTSGCGLNLNELGVEIPQSYHHRLDQDPNNLFKPMEYVGYEVMENQIIVAQVAHLMPSKEMSSLFFRKYIIYVKKDDEVGREVSVLNIYKFLIGHKKPKVTSIGIEDYNGALVPCDDGNEVVNLRANLHQSTLIEKKKNICDQLKEIYKLSPQLKSRALKRLYLKYHPDKNLDNPIESEILFMFLQTQIAHLDKGEPLDDPDEFQSSNVSREQAYSSQSHSRRFDYDNWNATAKKHSTEKCRARNAAAHDDPFSPFKSDINRPNTTEGMRWVRQAEIDLRVLQSCQNQASSNHGYAHVCFMAHQVVEKALKGGVYALCGLDGRTLVDSNLSRCALVLQTVKPVEAFSLLQHSSPLESYYLDTRYPNRWEGCTDVPSDHYKQEDAEGAKAHAEDVLRIVKSIMP